MLFFFFFNDTATTEIYTLSLHDALPISSDTIAPSGSSAPMTSVQFCGVNAPDGTAGRVASCSTGSVPAATRSARCSSAPRSEEHTSELQSRQYLVCRLLLEKKKRY